MSTNDQTKSKIEWEEEKNVRMARIRNIMMIVPLLFGFLLLTFPFEAFYSSFRINYEFVSALGIGCILISTFSLMLTYLQTGFQKTKADNIPSITNIKINGGAASSNDDITRALSIYSAYKVKNDLEIKGIKEALSSLKLETETKLSTEGIISAKQREHLIDSLKETLINEASKTASLEMLNDIRARVSQEDKSGNIDAVFAKTFERLQKETESLGRRGNLNLALGIITTIIGLSLLGFFVIDTKIVPEDKLAFVTSFIPRLSLVILIEIFAYFFLKLYKSSLAEIKYFQNETTNIESKYAAIQCAKFTDDKVAFSNAITALTSTERNALLEKGQTTAEIEIAKLENKSVSVISDKIMNVINNKKSEK